MPRLITRSPWTSQPQGPIGIAKDPTAAKLRILHHPSGGLLYDATGRNVIASSVQPTFGVSQAGRTADFTTSTVANVANFPYYPEFTYFGYLVLGGSSDGAPYLSIATHHTTNGALSDWFIYRSTSDSKLHVDIPWGMANVVVSPGTYATGEIRRIALRRTGTTGSWTYAIFVDGVKVASATTATNPATTAQTLSFNSFNSTGTIKTNNRQLLAGVFEGGLSDAEIARISTLPSDPWKLFESIQRTIWVPAAAGGGVSGTLATTNANDTSAATGTTTVTGTLATTNANDSSSASGTTTVTGTLATTNANDTSAASGSPVVVGTLATTNANDSVVASGDVGGNITGTVNYTNANDTGAASGTTTVTGSLATTNANDSASASGTTTVTGTSAYTNANDTVAASGAAGTVTGTVNVTNDNDTSAASGTAGNPVIASQGGGGWLPQTRRKSRKQIYEERVKLGILPPPVIKAAAKVAAVAQTVEEFKEERPKYEEMFLKAIKKTEWLPDYTRAIQAQLAIMEQEEEELLLLL